MSGVCKTTRLITLSNFNQIIFTLWPIDGTSFFPNVDNTMTLLTGCNLVVFSFLFAFDQARTTY